MENAQLISLSRQIALQRQMDVVANNMANINTTGFKAENLLFEDYLMPVAARQRLRRRRPQPALHAGLVDRARHERRRHRADRQPARRRPRRARASSPSRRPPASATPATARCRSIATGTLVDLNGNPVLGESGPINFDAQRHRHHHRRRRQRHHQQWQQGQAQASPSSPIRRSLAREGDNYYSGPAGSRRDQHQRACRARSSAPTSRASPRWPT